MENDASVLDVMPRLAPPWMKKGSRVELRARQRVKRGRQSVWCSRAPSLDGPRQPWSTTVCRHSLR
jgi:hypothetical protein